MRFALVVYIYKNNNNNNKRMVITVLRREHMSCQLRLPTTNHIAGPDMIFFFYSLQVSGMFIHTHTHSHVCVTRIYLLCNILFNVL